MSQVLYQKIGRRYHPVREYDSLVMDAMPAGSHLVVVQPGVKSCRYNVEPTHAPLLAALREHREALMVILRNASAMRSHKSLLTPKERKGLAAYCAVVGPEAMLTLESRSAADIIDALEAGLVARVAA